MRHGGSPSPTSTARSPSIATCSGSSCCGEALRGARDPRDRRGAGGDRLEIAMLRVPGGEVDVELIEYQGFERGRAALLRATTARVTSASSSAGIEALYAELAAKGVRFRSDGPVEMTGGPNKGGKSLYSLDPDGYIFEFHERPPDEHRARRRHAAARSATARRAVPADVPDPALRGARRGALPAGHHLRDGAQLRRPGGDRGRCRRGDARDGLPRRPPSLARSSDRGRRRPAADDGRDVRQADGLLQGARRLDAHRRPLARHPRLQRDRRRRHTARTRCCADRKAARIRGRRRSPSSATAPPGRARRTRG